MKFLIIRFSSIGDIVLTTPVIRCLKQQVPDAEVHYLTKKTFSGIADHNPHIDKLHLLDHSLDEIIEVLKAEQFDYVIDLHRNLRTLKVKKALGVKSFSFNKLNVRKWLLTNFKIDQMPKVHIVDRYMETVKSFGAKNDEKGLEYFIPKEDKIKLHDLPMPHQLAYIGIVIGAALNTKKLPLHKLQELCSSIDHPIVLLGGPEDKANGELIAAVDPIKIYNSCGKFRLNESADLIKKAKVIISHDTGLMHIATAFKKPVISIWGNTVPQFGMAPYYGKFHVTNYKSQVNGLSCRPCSKIGYSKCPKGHFKCMEQQDVKAVAALAMKWVASIK